MTHRANDVIELPRARDANHFLSSLDEASYRTLAPHMRLVRIETGRVLYDVDVNLESVYFPVTTAVSIQSLLTSKTTLGVAEIGREGVICADVIGGDSAMPRRVVVYRGGFAYRIDTDRFAHVCDATAAMRWLVFLGVQIVLAQIKQTLFCSRHHCIQHQLCRWLLIAHERTRSIEIPVTHGMLGQILGARRETVSSAALALQQVGLIRQHRGLIVLVNLANLEQAACNCHRLVRDEVRRCLGTGAPLPAVSTSQSREI